ncbi:MAG: 2-oxo acid dehydrogenase subunit E2 [Acidobacteria bacterium]|nr:2-oxo acid dehydrogenase subunit E2 [Acidobacteriota bacterium]
MSFEFKLPEIGEGVMEGEIVEWHVAVGDQVAADQPLVSVLTDKATVEIAAPDAGTIQAIHGQPGDVVEVGSTIAVFGDSGAAPAAPSKPAPQSNAQTTKREAAASSFSFPLPEIGEGVMEGEIVEWYVGVGDAIAEDQPLVSVLTDKATVEIPAPVSGTIVSLAASPGDIVAVGAELAVFSGAGVSDQPAAQPAREPAPVVAPATRPAMVAGENPSVSAFGTPLATPAVRRLAGQLGVDLHQIVGSGPHHRITRSDVESFKATPAAKPAPVATTAVETAPSFAPTSIAPSQGETREPIKGLRKAIHANMAKSKRIVPHFTYVEEVEMDRLVALRNGLKDDAAASGVKLSYLPFIAKAIALSIRKYPIMNASVDDAAMEVVFKHDINLGIATATEHGLMVPVVKHADQKTVLEIAADVDALAARARARKSSPADLSDGTFTITSLGRLGGLLATPIINHPEVAIFGVHNIVDRAVVRNGQIVIRKMMNVAVSFDHRVVDGDVGASFTQEVKSYLENPDKFLLSLK